MTQKNDMEKQLDKVGDDFRSKMKMIYHASNNLARQQI